jgi:DNA-directed RNA polymerase specialized sigma24 family protein
MFAGSPLSSEADPRCYSDDSIARATTANSEPHFPLTLSRLQLLYSQTRSSLLADTQTKSADLAFARDAVQEAFAAAAKNRFSFQSEKAAVAWIRTEISAQVVTRRSSDAPSFEPPYDWTDVLRRAKISTSTPVIVADAQSSSRWSLRALVRSWAKRLNSEGQAHSPSA